VQEYQNLLEELQGKVSEINGKYATIKNVPVHFMHQSINFSELCALYSLADVALVTPLIDGMNLVAKEYLVCQQDNNGVLILSEFAGAAQQLGKASLLVNPFNLEEVADRIYQAYHMEEEERKRRMTKLRAEVRRNSIFRWIEHYLSAVGMPLPSPHTTSSNASGI